MSLTMMVALVFGVLLCSEISTAQTAPPPAPPNDGSGFALNCSPDPSLTKSAGSP